MFYSSIHCEVETKEYPAAVKRVINYLKATDLVKLENGKHEIEGEKIFMQLFEITTKDVQEVKPEVHRKYIDLQFSVDGNEYIGCAPDPGNLEICENLLDTRDIIFYKEVENESFLNMQKDCFAVFFPHDVHRPGLVNKEPKTIRKAVIKISVDLI